MLFAELVEDLAAEAGRDEAHQALLGFEDELHEFLVDDESFGGFCVIHDVFEPLYEVKALVFKDGAVRCADGLALFLFVFVKANLIFQKSTIGTPGQSGITIASCHNLKSKLFNL